MNAVCKLAACAAVLTATVVQGIVATGHPPIPQEDAEQMQRGGYHKGLARVRARKPHKMDEGLRGRAIFKIRKAALEAAGLDETEIVNALASGPQRAFPFAAQPELAANSDDPVKTLTILIDFKDHRAATELPALTVAKISNNIYGAGNPAFFPHDSAHNYYSRASQGQVDLQGNVLAWHHFPKNRAKYEPGEPPPGTPEEELEDAQALLDNAANFKLVSDAMDALDATHDFAQYDNDNDGDIDLVTILYAGPAEDWDSFWWAYRWEFFIPEASKVFDGKTLRQFVFQDVDTRGSGNDDFDPTTLLHELGHAFGLADYYDYEPGVGADGGVGGLDMMHANQGNQCAFSRWLLDWIDPTVIGSGTPTPHQLTGSSSTDTTNKAIAIFPGLVDSAAPKQEMFIVESRPKIGNDAKMPGSGIVVWHVDASLNSAGNDFRFDNSFTSRKLIRLVRANKATDFNTNEPATAATYFDNGKELSPTSIPNSNGYNNLVTRIAVDQIANSNDGASLRIGFLPSPTPSPSPTPDAALAAESSDDGSPDAAVESAEPATQEPRPVAETVKTLASADTPVDLDALMELDRQLTSATSSEISEMWTDLGQAQPTLEGASSSSLTRQLLLSHWAAKAGEPAVKALLELPAEDKFVKEAYPQVMQSWAHRSPVEAAKWYLEDENSGIRSSKQLNAGSQFAEEVFKPLYLADKEAAVEGLSKLGHMSEVVGAVAGGYEASKSTQGGSKQFAERLKNIDANSDVIQATVQILQAADQAEEAVDDAAQEIDDPQERAEFQESIQSKLAD